MSGLVNEQAFEGLLLLITNKIGQRELADLKEKSSGCFPEILSPFSHHNNAFFKVILYVRTPCCPPVLL